VACEHALRTVCDENYQLLLRVIVTREPIDEHADVVPALG
jgi:hypothetical protein